MPLRPFKKSVAFLVMLITIISNASGINFKNAVLKPLEENFSAVALLTANDQEEGGSADFKPPKNSLIDYTAICSNHGIFSDYLPSLLHLATIEPFQFMPAVYLDIFVPPQNLA